MPFNQNMELAADGAVFELLHCYWLLQYAWYTISNPKRFWFKDLVSPQGKQTLNYNH